MPHPVGFSLGAHARRRHGPRLGFVHWLIALPNVCSQRAMAIPILYPRPHIAIATPAALYSCSLLTLLVRHVRKKLYNYALASLIDSIS